ncbi:MAG: ATP-binding cassette domain-containing protein [Oscillibacter sp.]
MELQVENLCKAYGGKAVLKNVSFTAGPGVTCVMAPSGGGKTTLLRLLLGLETPDSGRIFGAENVRWSALFQENRLLEQLTAAENIRFVLGPLYDPAAALALLEALGLGEECQRPVRDFSGGMKRRAALARALLAPCDALALDEPFTGLDGENRLRAMACIQKYGAGKPILLVTHQSLDGAELNAQMVTL